MAKSLPTLTKSESRTQGPESGLASGLRDRENAEVGLRLRSWRTSRFASREALIAILDQPSGSYPPSTYRNHEKGIALPNAEHLRKLASHGLDPTWLVTGQSLAQQALEIPVETSTAPAPLAVKNLGAAIAAHDLVEIPHYLAKFSAGPGLSHFEDALASVFLPLSFVQKVIRRKPEVLVFAGASGRSMSPNIEDGDFLAIDFTDKELSNDRIYAVSIDGNLLVKRVRRPLLGGVEFVSDNLNFPDVERVESTSNIEAYVVGQVVWNGGAPS